MKSLGAQGVLIAAVTLVAAPIWAQSGANTDRVMGEITSVDAVVRHIELKTDAGKTVQLDVRANAPVLRVAPGATDTRSAEKIGLTDLSVGDRIVASAHAAGSGLEAGSILVMSKTDLARARQQEQQDWRQRGVGGIVDSVDATSHSIALRSGRRKITVEFTGETDFLRYAPNSVKFANAKRGSVSEIQPGDQLRALGDKAADGATVKAERIISGTFRQSAATVTSIDPAKGEIVAQDLATKQPVTIRVTSDTTVKKVPPEMAAMLARRAAVNQEGARGGPAPSESADRAANQGRGPTAGGAMGDPNQMLDRLPPASLADLAPGDAIMFSSSGSADPAHATAIMLVAGVEPLLTAAPAATRDLMSGWLSGGGGDEEAQ